MHAEVQISFIPGPILKGNICCGLKTWRECADTVCELQAVEVSARQDLPIVSRQGLPSRRLSTVRETCRPTSFVPAAADLIRTYVVAVREARSKPGGPDARFDRWPFA